MLETIGRFDYDVSTFSVPGKGEYLTLASTDKTFECHLRVSAVRRAALSVEPAKIGGHKLYVIRLHGEAQEEGGKEELLLSTMLMYDPSKGPGNYLFGAVDKFNAIVDKYGGDIRF